MPHVMVKYLTFKWSSAQDGDRFIFRSHPEKAEKRIFMQNHPSHNYARAMSTLAV